MWRTMSILFEGLSELYSRLLFAFLDNDESEKLLDLPTNLNPNHFLDEETGS
jgi:hypothetical protein